MTEEDPGAAAMVDVFGESFMRMLAERLQLEGEMSSDGITIRMIDTKAADPSKRVLLESRIESWNATQLRRAAEAAKKRNSQFQDLMKAQTAGLLQELQRRQAAPALQLSALEAQRLLDDFRALPLSNGRFGGKP